jgi:hypothetical protein
LVLYVDELLYVRNKGAVLLERLLHLEEIVMLLFEIGDQLREVLRRNHLFVLNSFHQLLGRLEVLDLVELLMDFFAFLHVVLELVDVLHYVGWFNVLAHERKVFFVSCHQVLLLLKHLHNLKEFSDIYLSDEQFGPLVALLAHLVKQLSHFLDAAQIFALQIFVEQVPCFLLANLTQKLKHLHRHLNLHSDLKFKSLRKRHHTADFVKKRLTELGAKPFFDIASWWLGGCYLKLAKQSLCWLTVLLDCLCEVEQDWQTELGAILDFDHQRRHPFLDHLLGFLNDALVFPAMLVLADTDHLTEQKLETVLRQLEVLLHEFEVNESIFFAVFQDRRNDCNHVV